MSSKGHPDAVQAAEFGRTIGIRGERPRWGGLPSRILEWELNVLACLAMRYDIEMEWPQPPTKWAHD